MRISPGRRESRICDISARVSTPPIWHITLPPVPAFSQAEIARLSGSSPSMLITFSDIRTLMPITMSELTATDFAAASTSAKSMMGSSATGDGVSPILAICTKA